MSADRKSFVRELAKVFSQEKDLDENLQLLRSAKSDPVLFTQLLNHMDIPAHLVNGLFLEDGRRNQKLVKFLKVYLEDGSAEYYDMSNFTQGLPEDFII